MNIPCIYEEVKKWVAEYYGTKQWCYTDYFLDQTGYEYFRDQVETDRDITPDMTDAEIIEHIEEMLGKNMTMYDFQQAFMEATR